MLLLKCIMGEEDTSETTRRSVIKNATWLTLPAFTGVTIGSPRSQDGGRIVRIRRSYDDPITYEEVQSTREQQLEYEQTVEDTLIRDSAEPEFDDGFNIVDFVSVVSDQGVTYQYWGAAESTKFEKSIHNRASAIQRSVNKDHNSVLMEDGTSVELTTQSNGWNTQSGGWNIISMAEGDASGDMGTVKHNLEWRRMLYDGFGYNAFKSIIAALDDTFWNYDREIDVSHDLKEFMGSSDTYSIWEAGPSSGTGGSTGVSIGIPPSFGLSWTTPRNDTSHNLDLSDPPEAKWEEDLQSDGDAYWFKPGTTFKTDIAEDYYNPKRKLAELEAEQEWGWNVYDLSHTWNIYTYGNW